jgi:hypothetical protein
MPDPAPRPDAPLPPDDPRWTALQDLAADALPADEAAGWRERIAADRTLGRAWQDVLRVERALRSETLLPLPAGLTGRVRLALAPPAAGPRLAVLARIAAAVLLAVGAWLALAGASAPLATAAPPPVVESALVTAGTLLGETASPSLAPLAAAAPDRAITIALGVFALLGGLVVARRLARGARTRETS